MAKYDVIVIGSGLGGLSAATMMAHQGLDVLLLERHNVPGGYATSFVRGRYEFEVALHELSGIGPPEKRGALYRYLDEIGVTQRVGFRHTENLFRAVFPDLDVILPVGREAYTTKLCELFPHEAKGIRRFLDRVFAMGRDFGRIVRARGQVDPRTVALKYRHFFRYVPTKWGDVLNRDVQDPMARAMLSQYWGYVGAGPAEISFLFHAATLAAYVLRGAAFPEGRSQALAAGFLEAFRGHGGEARFGCGAAKVILSGGRAAGVITDEGEEIASKWVVSNADPIRTCHDLVGLENVPGKFLRKLQSSEVAPSTVNVYLGLNRTMEQLGLDEHEIFLNSDSDFDRHAAGMRSIGPAEAMAVTCYNAVYPEISPPDTSMVVLTALTYGQPWCDLPPERYVDTKNKVADSMIRFAEKLAPDLREYAEVCEVSTPITNMRFAGATGGSIYGFAQPPRDNMVWRMGSRGPVDNLVFAGAWTRPGGGFEPCMMSGRMAGAIVVGKLGQDSGEAS